MGGWWSSLFKMTKINPDFHAASSCALVPQSEFGKSVAGGEYFNTGLDHGDDDNDDDDEDDHEINDD